MANEQNLIPKRWTSEEAKKYGAMGGKKAGENRRRKADLRNAMNMLLTAKCDIPEINEFLKANGLDTTYESAVTFAMITKAMQGNVKAYNAILQTIRTEEDLKLITSKIAELNAKTQNLQAQTEKLDEKESSLARYTGIPASMVAPVFAQMQFDITSGKYNEFVLPGGRGSTKSSIVSLDIIDLIEKNPELHAAVYRKVANTLRDSVYAQICWAIQALGLEDDYKCTVSPMEIVKKSTGQKIFFRGCDDPFKSKSVKAPTINRKNAEKIKKQQLTRYAKTHGMTDEELQHLTSEIKVDNGYIGILWFEELDQFAGDNEVRTVEQSVIRGGDKTWIFKTFNPPKPATNWANKYLKIPKASRLVVESNYTQVPAEWLGKPFIDQAEWLKEVNPDAYENEYMGVANGSGGLIFDNVEARKMTDEEIAEFDNILHGIDWGFYPDPWAYNGMHYDAARHTLYIYSELDKKKATNRETADILYEHGITGNDLLTCDSAEQKSILDYKAYGLFARGAEKGPESRKYSYKWLQGLRHIYIDNERCPNTMTEFLEKEYERDKDGNIIEGYPDGKDHHIDCTRYATNRIWKRKGE